MVLSHLQQCYGTENGPICGLYILQVSIIFYSVGELAWDLVFRLGSHSPELQGAKI